MRTWIVARRLCAAALTSLCLGPLAAWAQSTATPDPIYTVELLVFRAGPAMPAADGASISSAGGGARFVGNVPAAQFRLGDMAARLRSTGAYREVAHFAWRQTAAPWGSRSGTPFSRIGTAANGVAGSAFLERGQYLHLGLSLTSGGSTLNEMRRVRLNEPNYYDHPSLGVIAIVSQGG